MWLSTQLITDGHLRSISRRVGRHGTWLAVLACLALGGCHQVTLVVKEIPANTPPGAPLFVSGNFNYWDPGDQRYMLKLNPDSTYSARLPRGDGTVFFRFTRGDWHTVESDDCGNGVVDRKVTYGMEDTVVASFASWGDLGPVHCNQVTLIIDQVPANTPTDRPLYLVGNFNNWNAGDPQYRMTRLPDGTHSITLSQQSGLLEYKITRGNWETEEVDTYGNVIQNRRFAFGKQDTLRVGVSGWKDFRPTAPVGVTMLVEVPPSTPPGDKIYLAANFNDWFPKDPALVLRKLSDGRYTLNLPRKADYIEFKFTRGDWSAVEADAQGNDIENRSFTYGRKDTLFLKVKSWRDIASMRSFE